MSTAKKKPPRPASADDPRQWLTYWLTRDADPETGAPSDLIDIWYQEPKWYTIGDRGGFWITDAGMADHFGRWTMVQSHQACGTAPDDARQCICVGPFNHARPKLPED